MLASMPFINRSMVVNQNKHQGFDKYQIRVLDESY